MNKFKNGKIGEEIHHLRKSKGISIVGLAKELKVSRQTIYLWENGTSTPTADKWEELKIVLGWGENR